MSIFMAFMELFEQAFLLIAHLTGKSSFPKPLTAAQEADAIGRMREGDTEARAALIEHNLRLVAHIAKKYQHSGVDTDDLVSIGSIGLIKAVHSFRPEAGRLTAYASRCIENEILMTLRANKKVRANCSFHEPIGADREGNEVMLQDILGTDAELVPDQAHAHMEAERAIRLIATALEPRERTVLVMRYGLKDRVPRPQHEIAEMLGISRSYVSRIEKRAIEKLRAAFHERAD